MNYKILKKALVEKSSAVKAENSKRFFKTAKGEYGEGDIFIGVSVPDIRLVAKQYVDTSLEEISKLLDSKIHEERLLGGILLVNRYKKSKINEQKEIHHFFLQNRHSINSWDLVDTTAPTIIGEYCFHNGSHKAMDKLVKSKEHWDRRLAILSTFAFIRKNELQLTYEYALILMSDKEDLMHKATGWMLREAGKRDLKKLAHFIQEHGKEMPRTMLRYSIEKFPIKKREKILRDTK
jgi:3-methyladenine DNA glycosylase AlkD